MVDVFIEFSIATFSIGCAVFEKIMDNKVSWFMIFQLTVTCVVFIPVHHINELICKCNLYKIKNSYYIIIIIGL